MTDAGGWDERRRRSIERYESLLEWEYDWGLMLWGRVVGVARELEIAEEWPLQGPGRTYEYAPDLLAEIRGRHADD